MSRFAKEISGELGEYWKKSAEKELADLIEHVKEKGFVEEDGAIRWGSNGNYLPADCCEKLEYANYNFSSDATALKREMQDAEFLKNYRERMKDYVYTDEDLNEMRAAFGKGSTVVDCITGRKIFL